MKVLDVFNSANDKRTIKNRVPFKEFYNDAINKEVNLKDHLIVWIQEKEKCRRTNTQYDKFKHFTLCSFPWLLDSANKHEMVKIFSR